MRAELRVKKKVSQRRGYAPEIKHGLLSEAGLRGTERQREKTTRKTKTPGVQGTKFIYHS